MKTNKSYSKRIKVTKNRKLLARKPGISHYLARESRERQLNRRKPQVFRLSNKRRGRFLPGVKAQKTQNKVEE